MKRKITLDDQQKAKRLKRLWLQRKDDLELTQVKAAKQLGITQASFSQYLNCVIALNTDMVLKMARLMKVSPYEIDPDLSERIVPTSSEVETVYVPVVAAIPGPFKRGNEQTVTAHIVGETTEPPALYAVLVTHDTYGRVPDGAHLIVDASGRGVEKDAQVVIQKLDQTRYFGRLTRMTKSSYHITKGDNVVVFPAKEVFSVHRVHSIQFPA